MLFNPGVQRISECASSRTPTIRTWPILCLAAPLSLPPPSALQCGCSYALPPQPTEASSTLVTSIVPGEFLEEGAAVIVPLMVARKPLDGAFGGESQVLQLPVATSTRQNEAVSVAVQSEASAVGSGWGVDQNFKAAVIALSNVHETMNSVLTGALQCLYT
eukprot:CAMPEP_0196728036 /NCGR_PEP_ID=MMETSP1091-20130531/8857_1 /TAXON_ID=302021 /ORGANISM="Rhodomonas sp., Strain CCMP768" /LENGTH=160 /DNA_ID=CAMNT_0042070735 /DNA_START=214 /DNA_END=695 /DNA_ORIENTATION=+